MKKQLISFDSPPEYPAYCEAIDCEHFDLIKGCLVGKEEWECIREAIGKAEKVRELIREEG